MSPMQRPAPQQLNERVSRVEGALATLAVDVQSISTSVTKLIDRISEGQRTNWPALIGVTAILLTVSGLWVNGYVRDQQGHTVQLQALQIQALDNARWRGSVEATLISIDRDRQ